MIEEKASGSSKTGAPLLVTINIRGLNTDSSDKIPNNGTTGLGELSLEHNADTGLTDTDRRIWLDVDGSSALNEGHDDYTNKLDSETDSIGGDKVVLETANILHYDRNGTIKLVIIDPAGDGDWLDDKFIMRLVTGTLPNDADDDPVGPAVPPTPSPANFTVTVNDKDPQPSVVFSKSSVSLTEGSETSNAVTVGLIAGDPKKTSDDPTSMGDLENEIEFVADNSDAFVISEVTMVAGAPVNTCKATGATEPYAALLITLGNGITYDPDEETFTTSASGGLNAADDVTMDFVACSDMSGYRDPSVTFTFEADSLTGMPRNLGNLSAGNQLVVTVQSNEAVPTVGFATSSLRIDEGSTETVAILADGSTGPEVGSVMVGVSGDAMISLWQDGDMLEADSDVMYEVDLMGSANTILTVSADSDRALEDGMTSMATITIMSANGADIGDRDSVSVTVMGSTAVAALPLLGQLLLALFLMAGGARLYRRRNG